MVETRELRTRAWTFANITPHTHREMLLMSGEVWLAYSIVFIASCRLAAGLIM